MSLTRQADAKHIKEPPKWRFLHRAHHQVKNRLFGHMRCIPTGTLALHCCLACCPSSSCLSAPFPPCVYLTAHHAAFSHQCSVRGMTVAICAAPAKARSACLLACGRYHTGCLGWLPCSPTTNTQRCPLACLCTGRPPYLSTGS